MSGARLVTGVTKLVISGEMSNVSCEMSNVNNEMSNDNHEMSNVSGEMSGVSGEKNDACGEKLDAYGDMPAVTGEISIGVRVMMVAGFAELIVCCEKAFVGDGRRIVIGEISGVSGYGLHRPL